MALLTHEDSPAYDGIPLTRLRDIANINPSHGAGVGAKPLSSAISHLRTLTGLTIKYDGNSEVYNLSDADLAASGLSCDAREFLRQGREQIKRLDQARVDRIDDVLKLWRTPRTAWKRLFSVHQGLYVTLLRRKFDLLLHNLNSGGRQAVAEARDVIAALEGLAVDCTDFRRDLERELAQPNVGPPRAILEPRSLLSRRPVLGDLDDSVVLRMRRAMELTALYVGLSQAPSGAWLAQPGALGPSVEVLGEACWQSVTSWAILSLRDAIGPHLGEIPSLTTAYFKRCQSREFPGVACTPTMVADGTVAMAPHFRFTASAAKFELELNGLNQTVEQAIRFLLRAKRDLGGWPEVHGGKESSILATTYVLDFLEKSKDFLPDHPGLPKTGVWEGDTPLALAVPNVVEMGLSWLAKVQQPGGWKAVTGGTQDLHPADLTAHVVCFLPQLFQRFPKHSLALIEPLLRSELSNAQESEEPESLARTALLSFGAHRIDSQRFNAEVRSGVIACISKIEGFAVSPKAPELLGMVFALLLAQLVGIDSDLAWQGEVAVRLDRLRRHPAHAWGDIVDEASARTLRRWLQR